MYIVHGSRPNEIFSTWDWDFYGQLEELSRMDFWTKNTDAVEIGATLFFST